MILQGNFIFRNVRSDFYCPTSHTMQLDIVLRALEAGKHVIQEKPVGPSKHLKPSKDTCSRSEVLVLLLYLS